MSSMSAISLNRAAISSFFIAAARCPTAVFMVSRALRAPRDLDGHVRVRAPPVGCVAGARRGRDPGDVLPADGGGASGEVAGLRASGFSILSESLAVHHPRRILSDVPAGRPGNPVGRA